MCRNMSTDVRGQPDGVGSLLLPCGLWDYTFGLSGLVAKVFTQQAIWLAQASVVLCLPADCHVLLLGWGGSLSSFAASLRRPVMQSIFSSVYRSLYLAGRELSACFSSSFAELECWLFLAFGFLRLLSILGSNLLSSVPLAKISLYGLPLHCYGCCLSLCGHLSLYLLPLSTTNALSFHPSILFRKPSPMLTYWSGFPVAPCNSLRVCSLTWSSLTHPELIFIQAEAQASVGIWISQLAATICWRACHFSTVHSWCLCWESGGSGCVGLYLGPLSYSTDLCICFYGSMGTDFFFMALKHNLKLCQSAWHYGNQ